MKDELMTLLSASFASCVEQQLNQFCYSLYSVDFNPLRLNSDLSQTSHYNIKGLSVSEVARIENTITLVKFSWYFNSFSPLLL